MYLDNLCLLNTLKPKPNSQKGGLGWHGLGWLAWLGCPGLDWPGWLGGLIFGRFLEGLWASLGPPPVDFGGLLGSPGRARGFPEGPTETISVKKPCARSAFCHDFCEKHENSEKT